jgi:hypothetical protein
LVDVTAQNFEDCACVNAFGADPPAPPEGGYIVDPDSATNGFPCTERNPAGGPHTAGAYVFGGGLGSVYNYSFDIPHAGDFAIQLMAFRRDGCERAESNDAGGIHNNIRVILSEPRELVCPSDRALDGEENRKLDDFTPDFFAGQFNLLPGNVAGGADVVLINFADFYGPPYRPLPASVLYSVSIFDEHEVDQSCGDAVACFARLGIDDSIVLSQNFVPPPPTMGPTMGPTIVPPTSVPPTSVPPTSGGGNNGGGSCNIAGPVQLGTAMTNLLIPLVPVAFAFGVRAIRRRKK